MMTKKHTKKSLKPCAEIGCGCLTRNSYCKIHQETAQKNRTKNARKIRDSKLEVFYQSVAWRRLRLLALERDNHLCQWCNDKGILNKARVVHHIVEVSVDWSLRLTLNNLISLCHSCHNRHHKRSPWGRKF